jgi:hypothetical protein
MTDDKARRPRRLSKTFLSRAKWAAGGLSVVAFAGSLFGIITLNPGVKIAAASANMAGQPTAPTPPPGFVPPVSNISSNSAANSANSFLDNSGTLVEPQAPAGAFTMPAAPVMPQMQPFARTRGS